MAFLDQLAVCNATADLCRHFPKSIEASFTFQNGASAKVDPTKSFCLKQVHGNLVVEAESCGIKDADGVYSLRNAERCSVVTADCLPLLLCSKDGAMVMAVHAGWRGLCQGIVANAIQIFAEKGFDAENILVAIGPHICGIHYEVGDDVVQALKALNLDSNAYHLCLLKGAADHYYADLGVAAVLQLASLGLRAQHIALSRLSTFSNKEWASYRRDGARSGRNVAQILVK